MTRLMPDSALSIKELDELLSAYGEPVAFAGDGYDVTLAALKLTEVRPVCERLRHQSAYSTAQVARRQYLAGNTDTDVSLSVNYLRPSQAERTRMEKETAKNPSEGI